MKNLILLLLAVVMVGCSSDEPCDTCENAEYYSENLDAYYYQPKDCDTKTPEGFVFVKCEEVE